jgi:acetyl esterase/lipase
MKALILLLPLFGLVSSAQGQASKVVRLWPGDAPGALGTNDQDIPTLTLYLPDPAKATGAAMVVCPGGGYAHLASHEGDIYAIWLTNQGIAAFVLKYRLGSAGYRHPVESGDAARALRMVRARAKEWNVDPKRVGIIGSSAGGHLASTLMTHFDAGKPGDADPVEQESCRPDIAVLVYPVITMEPPFVHMGSRENLLGKNPSPELVALLSNEKQVTKAAPPCFIFHGDEDTTVPVENSLEFAAALRRAGVPCELHIYEKGKHGIGLGSHQYEPEHFHPWVRDCELWLKAQGYAK